MATSKIHSAAVTLGKEGGKATKAAKKGIFSPSYKAKRKAAKKSMRFLAKYTPENPLSHFEIIEDTDNMGEYFKHDPMKLAGLMRRLGDWWVAYNKFMDEAE